MPKSKRLNVPFIEGLGAMSLDELRQTLERSGAGFSVRENNWPDSFPYEPSCEGSIAHSGKHLAVVFKVQGLDLRAAALEDGGNCWEDSCCEFFIAHPTDGTYYNFEMNCIGTLLCSKRRSRSESSPLSPEALKTVIRHSSLERKTYDETGSIHSWTVAMLVPFELVGLDGSALPESLKGNFYKCADLTAHPHYLSWSPISTPSPDFHRPEFFGEFLLSKPLPTL